MPAGYFKHACFVSYVHGQHDLVNGFITQLTRALSNELDAWLDETVYIDHERLQPGDRHEVELARAICESICLLVVYSPKYERHAYCMREFEAMRRVEARRLELLGPAAGGRGFIIPILLRGGDSVPDEIRNHLHFRDFSRFTLATPDMSRNPEYIEPVAKIAKVIFEHAEAFRRRAIDPCQVCTEFRLGADAEVAAWQPRFVNR